MTTTIPIHRPFIATIVLLLGALFLWATLPASAAPTTQEPLPLPAGQAGTYTSPDEQSGGYTTVADAPVGAAPLGTQAPQTVAYLSLGGVSIIDVNTKANEGYMASSNALFMATTPDNAYLYVVENSANSVGVFDTATKTKVATIAVGTQPIDIALTPDGAYAYVTNRHSNSVSVIQTSNNSVITTVTVGSSPFGVAVTPNGQFVYVTNENTDSVSVIATASNTVVATITSPEIDSPTQIAFTPNGAFAYVTNFNGGVAVIQTSDNSVVTEVTAGSSPFGVTITADGAYVYVSNYFSNNVSVIRTSDNTVITTIPTTSGGAWLRDIAITPDGQFVYVAVQTTYKTEVISTASNTVVDTISAGGYGIAFAEVSNNAAPDAADDSATTSINTAVTIDVLSNDSDPNDDALSISGVGAPGDGTAAISGAQIAYTPTTDFTGTDTFTYTISDGSLSDTATVSVTVRADVGNCSIKDNLVAQLQRTSFYQDANPVYASAGQSFTAPEGATLIDGITAYFGFIAADSTITLNLYNGPASGTIGTPIATATYTNAGPRVDAPAGSDLGISFRFSSPVSVTPGNVYYYLLSPSYNPVAFSYAFADGNPYSGGSGLSGSSSGTVGAWSYDLKFAVFLCLGGAEPFALTHRGPAANAVGVAPSANITATFDTPIDAGSVTTLTLVVRSNRRGILSHAATVVSNTVTLDPSQEFLPGERLSVVGTAGVRGGGGEALTPTQWGFSAGPVTNRCVNGFTDIDASLTGLSGGNAAWADYDLDGDLDFIVNGVSDYFTGTRVTQLYRNDGGSFAPVSTGLPNIDGLGLAWGDYDNDGDPDLLLSGYIPATNGFISDVYRNDGGGVFTPISAVPSANTSGSSAVAWGDYDNDGDLDFFLSGNRYGQRPTDVYRNDGNDSFTAIGAGINGASQGDAAWGDYDNDGDLDLLLGGYLSSGAATQLYRNDGGDAFTGVNTSLPAAGAVEWGDYNNDGLVDFVLIGLSNNYTGGGVYRNDGNGSFTAITSPLAGLYSGDATFGDFDNDGDLDLAVIGTPGSGFASDVFENTGNDTFVATNSTIIDVWAGSLDWGDYDNDGDLDLLLIGGSGQNTFHTKIYSNDDCAGGFNLTSHQPADKRVGVALTQNITATFDADLDAGSVTTETLLVRSNLRGRFNHTTTVAGNSLTVDTPDFLTGEQIEVVATDGIRSSDGKFLVPKRWNFSAGPLKNRAAITFTLDTTASAALTGVGAGSVAWGDYDNDGDLDILITGSDNGNNTNVITEIWENQGGGVFAKLATSMTGVWQSSVGWGDYDNDGDLDALVAGRTIADTPIIELWENQGGGSFAKINTSLPGVGQGSVAWGDYDNDGDLDLLITGANWTSTEIWENQGSGNFAKQANLTGVSTYSSSAWGDFDNDGDLDALISGQSTGPVTEIWENKGGGVFTKLATSLTGVSRSSVAWGDYDNDGDLDILLTGDRGNNDPTSEIWENQGGGVFAKLNTSLPGARLSTGAWGDFDNDGDLDIFLSGREIGYSGVWENQGGGNFVPFTSGLPGVSYSSGAWGDYDNDGDLDILHTGYGPIAEIWRNDDISAGPSTFSLSDSSPAANAVGVAPSANISATFAAPIDASSVTSLTFAVRSDLRGLFSGAATVSGNTITLDPSTNFLAGERVQVVATGGIRSTAIARLAASHALTPTQWGFTAMHVTNRCVAQFADSGAADDALSGINGKAVWGDYDDDGDLDILIAGNRLGSVGTYVYRNDNGVFVDVGAADDGLLGHTGSAAWIDYDNDSDLDIVVAGYSTFFSDERTRVFRNDGGAFVDSGPVDDALTPIQRGSVTPADYDNDGDVDILITGALDGTAQTAIATIFRNDNGIFVDSGATHAAIAGVFDSNAAWGDYDNDNDLDLLLTGIQGGGVNGPVIAKIYRNDGGIFADSGTVDDLLTPVSNAVGDWGDFDNDGDLDLLIGGRSSSGQPSLKVYRNNSGTFEAGPPFLLSYGFPAFQEDKDTSASVAWGDYDNDGDLDILRTGPISTWNNAYDGPKIYRNDGGEYFVNTVNLDDNIGIHGGGGSAWGDYDKDGDLDILHTGSGGWVNIYRNEDCAPIPGGDGNGDGIPDDQQANVETITSNTGNFITLAAPADVTLQNVRKLQPPATPPQDVTLPQGMVAFSATVPGIGGNFSITLTVHTGYVATSYWKYGPTPGNQTDHWYEFLYDGTTGAVINGRTITLYFVDGQRGDSDLQANGVVSDPGGTGGSTIDKFLFLPWIGGKLE